MILGCFMHFLGLCQLELPEALSPSLLLVPSFLAEHMPFGAMVL